MKRRAGLMLLVVIAFAAVAAEPVKPTPASPTAFNADAMAQQPDWSLTGVESTDGLTMWSYRHASPTQAPAILLVGAADFAAPDLTPDDREALVAHELEHCASLSSNGIHVVDTAPRTCRLHGMQGGCTTHAITSGRGPGRMICFAWMGRNNRLYTGSTVVIGPDADDVAAHALAGAMVGVQTGR